MQLLIDDLTRQPAQLEEARVTLYDAGSRLFVTHYANMQAALQRPTRPASPPTARSSSGNTVPTTSAGESNLYDANDATRVLEALLRLCGDVCVVVRGTSGEASATAAVHALHGLLVELPDTGLHPHGVHLAWRAMERLLFRGDDPCAHSAKGEASAVSSSTPVAPFAHTEAKQCTLAVVAAIVAAVCDSFRLQRMVAAAAAAMAGGGKGMVSGAADHHSPVDGGDGPPLSPFDRANSRTSSGGGLSSFVVGWVASPSTYVGSSPSRSPEASPDAQYFTRLLFVLQAVTTCNAVTTSYYFPSKPQTTLLEGVRAVWPTLTTREARMLWGEVLLPAFPSTAAVQRFVLQDVVSRPSETPASSTPLPAAATAAAAAPKQLLTLRSIMPPGSHPSYLSAVMDTMRSMLLLHMGIDAGAAGPGTGATATTTDVAATTAANSTSGTTKAEDDRTRLLFMAPSTLNVTGTLLLLHLASPAILAGPPRAAGVPFTLPSLFLQECADLLEFTLWGPVLSSSATTAAAVDGHDDDDVSVTRSGAECSLPATAAAARCRREGVAALCTAFENLLVATSTVVRAQEVAECTQTRPSVEATPLPPGPATPSSSQPQQTALTTTTTTAITTVAPHVTAALQSLDRLVDTLGEVVRLVMEQHDDVASATGAINVLSLASAAEGVALARVAKRSLALLQRWGDALEALSSHSARSPQQQQQQWSGNADSGVTTSSATSRSPPHHPADRRADTRASRSQLQDVVRASMEARNRAIMKQYIDNPDDVGAAALLIDTLRDMLRVVQQELPEEGGGSSSEGPMLLAMSEQWDAAMPELLQLVACCSAETNRSAAAMTREREVRAALSQLLSSLHERRRRWTRSQATVAAARGGGGAGPGSLAHGSSAMASAQQQRKRVTAAETAEAASII